MKDRYRQERECQYCKHIDVVPMSKREAAFELINLNDILGKNCSKCKENKFITHYYGPNLDLVILKEWSSNQELNLMPQDEELILADKKYVELILEILDTQEILDQKRNILIDSLCVIIYDNSIDDNLDKDEELKNRVITEINDRIELLKLSDEWIMNYIKKVVYPQLDLIS